MNGGQMVDDVRLGVAGKVPVEFYGRMGGVIPLPDEVFEQIKKTYASLAVEAGG
jgi:2-oxoglutarate ferredoxin oxidoreductase subunit alpha